MADVINMPKLGFDMAEGTLIRWVKAEGETVEKGELLAEIETDKATVEVESLFSGTVRKHFVTEGAIVPVNNPIAIIGGADEDIDFDALGGDSGAVEASPAVEEPVSVSEPVSIPQPAAVSQDDGQLPGGVKASPLARRMAADAGIDLRAVTGTGSGGRIVKKDIEAYKASPTPKPVPPTTPSFTPITAADLGPAPADTTVPLTRLRQAIGRRMVQSKQEFPAFYITRDYDAGPVIEARKQANTFLAASGEKLSVNDFVVKAAALALREFPNLNAALQEDAVVRFGQVNVGVAVSVEAGLMTVVVPDTDRKTLRQISQEVKEKAARARAGKVRPEDVSGSTFSVSNLGMFGVDDFIAIINPPEAAILAVGSAAQVPVVKDGVIKPGWRMKMTISADHRVTDGAEAAQFMQALAKYIENPAALML